LLSTSIFIEIEYIYTLYQSIHTYVYIYTYVYIPAYNIYIICMDIHIYTFIYLPYPSQCHPLHFSRCHELYIFKSSSIRLLLFWRLHGCFEASKSSRLQQGCFFFTFIWLFWNIKTKSSSIMPFLFLTIWLCLKHQSQVVFNKAVFVLTVIWLCLKHHYQVVIYNDPWVSLLLLYNYICIYII
jgi:hypothetical protein